MEISRRDVAAVIGGIIFPSSGCIDTPSSSQNTTEITNATETRSQFKITDISILNKRKKATEVTVLITKGSEIILEETLTLAPKETKTYENIMANDKDYEVTITADGLKKTEMFNEHRDNAGLYFTIKTGKIESVKIVH